MKQVGGLRRQRIKASVGPVLTTRVFYVVLIAVFLGGTFGGHCASIIQPCSGELHSTRIPREHWQHRLQMAKALGLNTVSTYVFWSQHEAEPGKFDWTGQIKAHISKAAQQKVSK